MKSSGEPEKIQAELDKLTKANRDWHEPAMGILSKDYGAKPGTSADPPGTGFTRTADSRAGGGYKK